MDSIKANNERDEAAADGNTLISSPQVKNETLKVTGGSGGQTNVTYSSATSDMTEQETTPSAGGLECIANRSDPEIDRGVQINDRTDSGFYYCFIDSIIIPGVEQLMGDVGVLEPPMEVQVFRPQPDHGGKSDIIQLNARGEDGTSMR